MTESKKLPLMKATAHWTTTFGEEQTQPQTEEQRGMRACAPSARGSITKSVKGLLGEDAPGTAEHALQWTTALIPRGSGTGTHPHRSRANSSSARTRPPVVPRLSKDAARRVSRRSRKSNWRPCVPLRLRVKEQSTWMQSLRSQVMGRGDECSEFFFDVMFRQKEKEALTKMFDDDGWIRPLTEAETITVDIPEDKYHTRIQAALHTIRACVPKRCDPSR